MTDVLTKLTTTQLNPSSKVYTTNLEGVSRWKFWNFFGNTDRFNKVELAQKIDSAVKARSGALLWDSTEKETLIKNIAALRDKFGKNGKGTEPAQIQAARILNDVYLRLTGDGKKGDQPAASSHQRRARSQPNTPPGHDKSAAPLLPRAQTPPARGSQPAARASEPEKPLAKIAEKYSDVYFDVCSRLGIFDLDVRDVPRQLPKIEEQCVAERAARAAAAQAQPAKAVHKGERFVGDGSRDAQRALVDAISRSSLATRTDAVTVTETRLIPEHEQLIRAVSAQDARLYGISGKANVGRIETNANGFRIARVKPAKKHQVTSTVAATSTTGAFDVGARLQGVSLRHVNK